MIHRILVDFNNFGNMFEVFVESELSLEEVLAYFQQYSNDARVVDKSIGVKKLKGKRKIPIGTIIGCRYRFNKISTFKKKREKLASFSPELEVKNEG